MPLFEDSYQTTVGSAMVVKPIETAIKEAVIMEPTSSVDLDVRLTDDVIPVFILGAYDGETKIPPFAHPLKMFDNHHRKMLVTDMRFFVDKNVDPWKVEDHIRNRTEFNFAKSRAILNLLWVTGHTGEIRNGLPFAGAVYASLISEVVSKIYALDFRDKTVLQIAAHLFYQTLFTEQTEFDEDTRQKMAIHTMNVTKAPSEMVYEVLDKMKPMKTIVDFCEWVRDVVENVRLKDFNFAVLLTGLKNSWYGTNSKEIISVGVEHPPTFAAIVYSSLSERTYKNSQVYRIADSLGKRGVSDMFMKNFVNIIRENTKQKTGHSVEIARAYAVEALESLGSFD